MPNDKVMSAALKQAMLAVRCVCRCAPCLCR